MDAGIAVGTIFGIFKVRNGQGTERPFRKRFGNRLSPRCQESEDSAVCDLPANIKETGF